MARISAADPNNIQAVPEDERFLLDYCKHCPMPDRLDFYTPTKAELYSGWPPGETPDSLKVTYHCDNGHKWTRGYPASRPETPQPAAGPLTEEEERALVGGLLAYPDLASIALGFIPAKAFKNPSAFAVHRTFDDLFRHGEPTGAEAVAAALEEMNELSIVGGRAFLRRLLEEACQPADLIDLAYRMAGAQPPTFKRKPAKAAVQGEPVPTALYRWYDVQDNLLYVGITGNMATRQSSHSKRSSWSSFAVRSTVEHFPSRPDADVAERAAIESERPLFNHVHNDTPEARARLVAYLIEHGRMDLLTPAVSRG